MNQVYDELGALISAIGTNWFGNMLPAALQCAFNYDYFLLARYTKGQPLHIIRSDFREVEMQQTLQYLVTETYVAEPIYRLYQAGKTSGGIFDMADLTRDSLSLPDPIDYTLPHLIKDNNEEIGWRTVGWPEYQQETCILVPLPSDELISVSLFNFGLTTGDPSSREKLDPIYPILANTIARNFEISAMLSHSKQTKSGSSITDQSNHDLTISHANVTEFFNTQFSVTLTPREAEIFTLLLQGDTMAAIANKLFISVYTVRTHRRNVYRRIGHGRLLDLINQFHIHLTQQAHH